MADPVLHLSHQVLANALLILTSSPLPDPNDEAWVAVLRDEVLPLAARGVSPAADALITAAEAVVGSHAGRGKTGQPSLIWSVAKQDAGAVVRQYFNLRAAQGLDRLRAQPGGQNAA